MCTICLLSSYHHNLSQWQQKLSNRHLVKCSTSCARLKQQRAFWRFLAKPKTKEKARNHRLRLRLVDWYSYKRSFQKSCSRCMQTVSSNLTTAQFLNSMNFLFLGCNAWLINWLTLFKRCISRLSKILMIMFWIIIIKSPFSYKYIYFFLFGFFSRNCNGHN